MSLREKCAVIVKNLNLEFPGTFFDYSDDWSDEDVEWFVANYEEYYYR
jgi:hypothetical protein